MEPESYIHLSLLEDPYDECTFIIHPTTVYGMSQEEITQLYSAVRALKLCRQGHPVPYYITASFQSNQEYYTLFLDRLVVLMIIQNEPSGHIKSFFYRVREEENNSPVTPKRKPGPEDHDDTPPKCQKT